MALDFPASGTELWAISDTLQVRPEFLLPVLWQESNFSTTVQNGQGADNWGLNQIAHSWLTNHGIALSTYLAMPASKQLQLVVGPFLKEVIQFAKPTTVRSGARVYQATFYPGSLSPKKSYYAPHLDSVIVSRPAAGCTKANALTDPYCANAGLDFDKSGTITVSDLAEKVRRNAALPVVQAALTQTYALRPNERMQDPALGDGSDFPVLPPKPAPSPASSILVAVLGGALILGTAGAAAWYLTRPKRLRRAA